MDIQRPLSVSARQFAAPANVMVRPLLLKPQWMNGLSERLLVSHYENNYGGALRRLNAIRARLAALDWARTLSLLASAFGIALFAGPAMAQTAPKPPATKP